MKLAIVGNNDGPLRLARKIEHPDVEVVFVGLQKKPRPALLKKYQNELGLSTQFAQEFAEPELLQLLEPHTVDLLINCFCSFKFVRLLESYSVLNVHLSLLPKYRGRHPLHWALINGEQKSGASIHRMTSVFDGGEILHQVEVPIVPGDSVQRLRERILQKLESEFPDFIHQLLKKEIRALPNKNSDATYIARRFPKDSELTEWKDPGRMIRKVFALASEDYPAFLEVDGAHLTFKAAHYLGKNQKLSKDLKVEKRSERSVQIAFPTGYVIRFEMT